LAVDGWKNRKGKSYLAATAGSVALCQVRPERPKPVFLFSKPVILFSKPVVLFCKGIADFDKL